MPSLLLGQTFPALAPRLGVWASNQGNHHDDLGNDLRALVHIRLVLAVDNLYQKISSLSRPSPLSVTAPVPMDKVIAPDWEI